MSDPSLAADLGSLPAEAHQPRKRSFGKKKVVVNRSFQPSWFEKWPWLHYIENDDAVVYLYTVYIMYCQYKVNNYIKVYIHVSIIMCSLIISMVQFNQTAETYHVNECLAILAESGSETTSELEVLKIQNFPGGTCPQNPLVGACFAHTLYIDTSISATNGLSTFHLLPTPLHKPMK